MKTFRKFTDVIERVEHVRKGLGLNKSQFSRAIGLKPQTYNNFVGAQQSKPNVELLYGIVANFRVNPMWLLTGQGNLFAAGSDCTPERARLSPGSGSDRSGLQGDGWLVEGMPEMALVKPILERVEEKFERLDRECAPLLARIIQALQRYSRVNSAGSAGELREFLEHIERKVPGRLEPRHDA